jgi:hypothetical protein
MRLAGLVGSVWGRNEVYTGFFDQTSRKKTIGKTYA